MGKPPRLCDEPSCLSASVSLHSSCHREDNEDQQRRVVFSGVTSTIELFVSTAGDGCAISPRAGALAEAASAIIRPVRYYGHVLKGAFHKFLHVRCVQRT